jgi:UDP-3-O-[3-hydroxymyristoyl] glucosamine N-acyltransferase
MILLNEILIHLPALSIVGRKDREIQALLSATGTGFTPNTLTWVSDKNEHILSKITLGTVICSSGCDRHLFQPDCTYVIVANPRSYFSKVIHAFFLINEPCEIHPSAHIHPTTKVGQHVSIKAGVVIEANCIVGDNTRIDCNSVIKMNTVIGTFVKIGANTTIGGSGFGYEKDEDGLFQEIPHIGNVVIEDYVEIGNNTAIDRAVLGSTFLRKNCKIDNLVHIAHGVEIGENSLIIANAMIGGSSVIGKNVWVAPSSSILNKLTINDESFIGMGAVVLKNVFAGQTVVGNPAKELSKKQD